MTIERNIVLSSKVARNRNASNKPENFTFQLSSPVILPRDKKYKVALLRLQASYSWYNISSIYGNNTIRYSPDSGVTFKNIVFPNGVYSYSDLNSFIQNVMFDNGDYTVVSGVNTYAISLSFDLSTFRVSITITDPTYSVDLVNQTFANIIGFTYDSPFNTTQIGGSLPDITRGIDNLYIHCSLITDSIVNGSAGDVLFSFETGTLSRSYSFTFEPFNLSFSPMIGNEINEIRMTLTDVFNNPLDLNGIDVSYTITVREI